ncbi:MAG: serine/threonine-protein kinase [Myxococcota bacterium]
MGRLIHIWIGAVVLVLFGGCAGADAGSTEMIRVERWTFTSELATESVTLPVHVDADLPSRPSTYSLSANVELPASMRGTVLTFAVPHLLAHTDLWVDGQRLQPLDAPPADQYRALGPHRWQLSPDMSETDRLSLRLEVRSTWTQAGWLDSVPRLSTTTRGDAAFLRAMRLNAGFGVFGFVALCLTGFAHVVVFVSSRRRVSAAGYFTLEAIFGVTYPAFVCGLLQPVFGVYDAAVMGVGLILTTTANVYFVHAYCGLGRLPRWWWMWTAIPLVAYLVWPGPFSMSTHGAPVTIAVMFANCVYQTFVGVRLYRTHKAPVHRWIVPLAWPMAHVLSLTDFAAWIGHGDLFGDVRSGAFGIGFVALVQTLALSRQHVFALRRADGLNAELTERLALLQAKNAEVERLNTDLRRQIEGRSSDLVATLASLETSGMALAPWTSGTVVDQRYEVISALGHGGMGDVYLARRLADDRELAIKRLRAQGVADMARFAREAQIISKVQHPNVISIEDVEMSDSAGMYLVMELVEGRSLQLHQDRYGDLDWCSAVLRGVAEGLVALHALGIVHRDLKPSNILVETDGKHPRPKLADFGISGFTGRMDTPRPASLDGVEEVASAETAPVRQVPRLLAEGPALTESGVVFGTPRYMAPECSELGARAVGTAADVYAFGLIALELLFDLAPTTRAPPLRDLDLEGLRTRCPACDPDALAVLIQCVDPEPDARPTAQALVDALLPSE